MVALFPNLPIKRHIPNVKKTLMIASGKGGVGKSTMSANIAVGLARRGLSVGLLDLDLYGPSIPRLMGFPETAHCDAESDRLSPLTNYGVKCMSMGFLTPPDGIVAWRGLMVMKGVQQMLWKVNWGEQLDVLVMDMPPGTGDTHLTVCQQVIIDSSIIVTTPQQVALSGTEKGLRLLQTMKVPVMGIIENMKWIECNHCHQPVQLFNDKTNELAKKYNIPIIGNIPMVAEENASMDNGVPSTAKSTIPVYYEQLISKIVSQLDHSDTKTSVDHSNTQ